MTIAAKQLREAIVAEFPGTRISRKACRPTAGGFISQHSAYGGEEPYDSNALDVMGGPLGYTWDENVARIQAIVDWLQGDLEAWSIRKILWQVHDHYGHAHIDFYPMLEWPDRWCGGPETPRWRLSDGSTVYSRNPEPENGRYIGDDKMTLDRWVTRLRPEDIDQMGAVGILKPAEVIYFRPMLVDVLALPSDAERSEAVNDAGADWQNLRDAYDVRAPLYV